MAYDTGLKVVILVTTQLAIEKGVCPHVGECGSLSIAHNLPWAARFWSLTACVHRLRVADIRVPELSALYFHTSTVSA
jgi:hypothetical protein